MDRPGCCWRHARVCELGRLIRGRHQGFELGRIVGNGSGHFDQGWHVACSFGESQSNLGNHSVQQLVCSNA